MLRPSFSIIVITLLAGSYVGRINAETNEVTVLEQPTPNQEARQV